MTNATLLHHKEVETMLRLIIKLLGMHGKSHKAKTQEVIDEMRVEGI